MFQRMDDIFVPTTEARLPVIAKVLPPGNYHIAYMPPPAATAYLTPVENFTPIGKYYGDMDPLAERIIHTYQDRSRNTGVLLHGIKGSGKTLLAKLICLKMKCPVLIIHEPVSLNTLVQVLNAITGDCVVLFDEFEKNFSSFGSNIDDDDGNSRKPAQDKILSVLDGVYSGKKLFLLTVNDKFLLSRFLLNRPGRLYYAIEFDGLSIDFVREYCQDCLKDHSKIEDIVRLSSIAHKFTFDAMQAVVEEVNRYGEKVPQAVKMLNLDLLEGSTGSYDVVAVDTRDKSQITYHQTLGDINSLNLWMAVPAKIEGGKARVMVTAQNLVKFDGASFYLQVDRFSFKITRKEVVPFGEKLMACGYDDTVFAPPTEDISHNIYRYPDIADVEDGGKEKKRINAARAAALGIEEID